MGQNNFQINYLILNNLGSVAIELSDNKLKAMEQIMNAVYLNSRPNYSDVVKVVIQFKKLYAKHDNEMITTDELIQRLLPVIDLSGLSIENNDAQAILTNATFDTNLIFTSPADKQKYINEWFRVNSGRIYFDGLSVKFTQKFVDELSENARGQLKKSRYNNNDELSYSYIVPAISELDLQASDQINQEFERYVQQIENRVEV